MLPEASECKFNGGHMNTSAKARKHHAHGLWAVFLLFFFARPVAAQSPPQAVGNGVQVEAVRTVTSGCIFGGTTSGQLGLGADQKTLSTATTGGVRPSLQVSAIGVVTLSMNGALQWQFDGQALSGVSSSNALMNAATGGSALTLPLQLPAGSNTYHLEMTGTHSTGFTTAGTYKALATFTCA